MVPAGAQYFTFARNNGMKAVILAGGLGTRLSEETNRIPKPMVTIGNRPILWHIMKLYSKYGITDFVICAGYKSHAIVEFFANYREHHSNVTVDLAANKVTCLSEAAEPWKITIIDTGEDTETGGRIKRVRDHLDPRGAILPHLWRWHRRYRYRCAHRFPQST